MSLENDVMTRNECPIRHFGQICPLGVVCVGFNKLSAQEQEHEVLHAGFSPSFSHGSIQCRVSNAFDQYNRWILWTECSAVNEYLKHFI